MSLRKLVLTLGLCLFIVILIGCQQSAEPIIASGNTMDMTLPDVTRIASYDIDVALDPDTKQLQATEKIRYLNTKAEPFSELVFHLYLNGFRDRNSYFMSDGAGLRGFGFDDEAPGWIEVSALSANGVALELELLEDDTLARVELPFAVATGEQVEVEVAFTAQLPRAVARTGFGEDFFMVGQWFPKLGVWEEGAWNAYPFYPNNEFYADFGAYDVAITLPSEFVVGGSGVEVSSAENSNNTKTVRYQADPVIDFAWTASPNFATATRNVLGVELLYLYLPDQNGDTSEKILNAAAVALETNTHWFGPYPYERLTLVDVPPDAQGAGGMEYPTLVTVGTLDLLGIPLPIDLPIGELIAIHEVGHQWFQSMLATNEVEEPWLDEGITDYATALGMQALYGENNFIDSGLLDADALGLRRSEYLVSAEVPMFGGSNELENYGVSAYSKPTTSLTTLQGVLGDDVMRRVMRTYVERYRFKHPTTADFRQVAEEVSGQSLEWFFDGMVFGRGVVNYKVSALDETRFTALREGTLVIPVDILVTFVDGTTELLVWDDGESELMRSYPAQRIERVEIDPERKIVVDMRWLDNGMSNSADISSWLKILSRLLFVIQDLSFFAGGL